VSGTPHDQLYDAFGAYVRSQRHLAQLTLRQVADLARISNPYLSQIEHGLVLPSIAVLGALADALSVSAETMLLRAAGIVRPNHMERSSQTEHAIRHDFRLDTGQKHALLAVLSSFVASASGDAPSRARSGEAEIPPGVADEALSDNALSDQVLSDRSLPRSPWLRQVCPQTLGGLRCAAVSSRVCPPDRQQPAGPRVHDEKGYDYV